MLLCDDMLKSGDGFRFLGEVARVEKRARYEHPVPADLGRLDLARLLVFGLLVELLGFASDLPSRIDNEIDVVVHGIRPVLEQHFVHIERVEKLETGETLHEDGRRGGDESFCVRVLVDVLKHRPLFPDPRLERL